MNKIIILLTIIFSPITFADEFDDALTKIKDALNENHKVYKEGMEKAHQSRLEDFFYMRNSARQVILQSIYEKSMSNVLFTDELVKDLQIESDRDNQEMLYRTLIVKESLEEQLKGMKRDYQSLKDINDSSNEECEESYRDKLSKKYNPLSVYPIPTIRQTESGFPQYDLTFMMNMSYNIDNGSYGFSVGKSASQEYEDETKTAVVFVGAAIAQIVGCCFGSCDGVVFMAFTAILSTIYDITFSVLKDKKAEEFKENVDKAFAEANHNIYQVHVDLNQKSDEMIQNICLESDKAAVLGELKNYMNVQRSFIKNLEDNLKEINRISERYFSLIKKDKSLLMKMFGEKRSLLLNKFRNSLVKAREIYSQNGIEIFNFYTNELFPLYAPVNGLRSLDRLKQRQLIMEKIVQGNIMFGDNFTWKSLKENLKDGDL
jgi:hypothetical protein